MTTMPLLTESANDQQSDALALVLRGADVDLATAMRQTFAPFLAQTAEWEQRAKAIQVTDPSQTREMKIARESRLAIREVRIAIEKARKELKESALKRSQLVDGCARVLRERLEPIEAALLEQEQFAERHEAARKDALGKERRGELVALGVNVDALYPGALLGEMDAAVYSDLRDNAKLAAGARAEAAKRAEEARVAQERQAAETLVVVQAEAARLEQGRQERERAQAEENARLRAEKLKLEAERRAEAEAAKAKEREADELRAQIAEKDRALRAEAEKREQAEREAEQRKADDARRAAAAPDRERLLAWAASLPQVPALATEAGRAIGEECTRMRDKLMNWTTKKAGALTGDPS